MIANYPSQGSKVPRVALCQFAADQIGVLWSHFHETLSVPTSCVCMATLTMTKGSAHLS